MKGYEYLKKGLSGDLEPKTIIRTEHINEYESFDGTKDYDYYIYQNDNMFHRCDKHGKLGAKSQDRFLNYKVLEKEFEMYCVIEEEKKIPEKLKWNEKSQYNVATDNTKKTLERLLSRSEQLKKSINQIVDYLDYLKSKGE